MPQRELQPTYPALVDRLAYRARLDRKVIVGQLTRDTSGQHLAKAGAAR